MRSASSPRDVVSGSEINQSVSLEELSHITQLEPTLIPIQKYNVGFRGLHIMELFTLGPHAALLPGEYTHPKWMVLTILPAPVPPFQPSIHRRHYYMK